MKKLSFLFFMASFVTTAAFAQSNDIFGDLSAIELYEDVNEKTVRINYPGMFSKDCFMVDVVRAPKAVTKAQKQAIANKLIVLDNGGEVVKALRSSVKGNNVVFYLQSTGLYSSTVTIKTKNGKSFKDISAEVFTQDAQDSSNYIARLLFVEQCRL